MESEVKARQRPHHRPQSILQGGGQHSFYRRRVSVTIPHVCAPPPPSLIGLAPRRCLLACGRNYGLAVEKKRSGRGTSAARFLQSVKEESLP